jgi:hypothetical protein
MKSRRLPVAVICLLAFVMNYAIGIFTERGQLMVSDANAFLH